MDNLALTISIPERVLFRDLDGEAVVLHLDTGQYYGLNSTGTQMWALLSEHQSVERVYEALKESYEVSEELLLRDLLAFVQELTSRDLLRAEKN